MNFDRKQERIALVAGILLAIIALGSFICAQRFEPVISTHYLTQTGTILFIAALIAFLSTFHAYLARLALQEKREKDDYENREEEHLFGDELEEDGRHQRSLVQFEKIIIPVLLIILSCLEIALTSWCVWMETTHIHEVFPENRKLMLPIASMAATASILLFVLSKYCSGIAFGNKQYYLRSVSGYTLFCSGICALNAAVSLIFYWGAPDCLNYFTWSICIASYLLAAERVVVWIVDVYRPQSKHIQDLTVYESRLLGLFSQPQGFLRSISDLIDYQFGLKISEGLIYRCFTKVMLPYIILQLVTLNLLLCLVYIQPEEKGVLEEWGADSLTVLDAGLHLKKPWPICRVYRVTSERAHQLSVPLVLDTKSKIKSSIAGNVSTWLDEHFNKSLFLTASFKKNHKEAKTKSTQSLSVNLTSARIIVHYKITDSLTYYKVNSDPQNLLTYLSQRQLSRYMIGHDFSSLLKTEIKDMDANLTTQIQHVADEHNMGVRILHVSVVNLQPPPTVAGSYREVIEALEQQNRKRLEAEQYAVQILAEADHETNRAIRVAESDTALITQLAQAEKSNYLQQYKIYKKYSALYKTRSTMDVLEEWLQDVRKIVTTIGDAREVINLELKKARPDLLSVPLE